MQENLSRSSEQDFRLRSAVRQLCKWRAVWGLQKFREYLSKYQIDSQLLNLFADQWQKGNKGEWGKWI
jgi:hypothetical protein